jgi:hypothetical protein
MIEAMRLLAIALWLVCAALPAGALAAPPGATKTKIAVAPLDGDPKNQVARAVAEALASKDTAVVGPREVGRELDKLGISGEIDGKATRKLVAKLGVIAVVDGKVTKAGGKRFLHLGIHRRGKPEAGFTMEFTSTSSKAFRRGVREQVEDKLSGAGDDTDADDQEPASRVADHAADDEAARKAKPDEDEAVERKRKAQAQDEEDATERKRKARADDDAVAERKRRTARDDDRKPRRVAADDDDRASARRRKGRDRSDEAPALPALRVDAGGAVAQRQLAWDIRTGLTQVPPRVVTYAASGRVDGEVYPLALAGDRSSALAGLGLAAAYDRAVGLSIKIPNQNIRAPIRQSHYAIGARYRLALGEGGGSSASFGLDYARRQYVADRSNLGAATLDTPDFDYAAVSPSAALRVPVIDSVAAFASADGLVVFDAGGVAHNASYGPATVYGYEGAAGADIAITRQIGVRVALEFSQILFKFTPRAMTPTLANNRDGDPSTQDIMGATDRSIGGTVTLGITY